MSAPGSAEAAIGGHPVGDNGRSHLVHLRAPVFFGDVHRAEPQLACFPHQRAVDREFLFFHSLDVGNNFVFGKFLRCLRNQGVLFREILRREYLFRPAFLQQKAAAGNLCRGYCRHRGHGCASLASLFARNLKLETDFRPCLRRTSSEFAYSPAGGACRAASARNRLLCGGKIPPPRGGAESKTAPPPVPSPLPPLLVQVPGPPPAGKRRRRTRRASAYRCALPAGTALIP